MRPLSPYEAVVVARANLDIYYTFVVGAKYSVPLSVDRVLKTVALICQKYPHFSLRVVDSSVCDFTKNKYIIDESLIDVITSVELDGKLDYYNTFKFDYKLDQPLWKIVYVTDSNSLYFIVDHTYFDGTAAKKFHESFSVMYNEEPKTYEVDPTTFGEYPDPTVLMGFKSRETVPQAAAPNDPTLEKILVQLQEERTKLPMVVHRKKMVSLGSEKTKHLLSICRANGIKMTGLLYAIVTKSLIQVLPDVAGKVLSAMVPINTRPKDAPLDIVQFGMFFGKYFHQDAVDYIEKSELFDLARIYQQNLNDNIPKAMCDYEVFQTKALENPELIYQSMEAMAARNNLPMTNVQMSNIGVIDSDVIEDVYFDQPLVDASFALHVVSSKHSGMAINLMAHRGVSEKLYDAYVTHTLELLNSV